MKTVFKQVNNEIISVMMIGDNDTPQEDYEVVPDDYIGAVSVLTHYIDADGNLAEYSPDLKLQRINGKPAYSAWNVNLGWIDQTPIDKLKELKIEKINLERMRRNELPIEYVGIQFDADATAQRNVSAWMTNIAAGQNPPAGFVWRGYDNVDHPADAAFVVGLGNAITLRGTYLYQRSWIKKAEVDALTTAEAVKAYDVTTGW